MKKMMLAFASLLISYQANTVMSNPIASVESNVSKQQELDKKLGRILLNPETNVKEIEDLLSKGANVNRDLSNDFTPDNPNQGMTPLLILLTGNPNPDVAQTLISAGADVNAVNSEGKTPLMYAVNLSSNEKIVNALLRAKADVNAVITSNGVTPLMLAILKPNNLFTIETLIKGGADVNAKDAYGKTPLMYASESIDDPIVVSLLANSGAKINDTDDNGETALMYAISKNRNSLVALTLIRLKADVNITTNRGVTAVGLAQKLSRMDIVDALLNVGGKATTEESLEIASKNKEVKKKKFAPSKLSINEKKFFYLAGKPNITPEELQKGIDKIGFVNIADNKSTTPLILLASKTDNPKNIEVLINAKAEVNVVDNNNLTPLVAAARFNKNPEIIKVLAKNGADVNAKTTQGKTPLMLAVSNENSLEIIKALIEVGADINEKDDAGNDLLNNIITNSPDRSDIIEILIKNKVNLTNSDRNGFTPFLIAVFKDSDTKVLKTLVDAGANINLTNKFGENALDIAVKHSSKPENVKFLIDLGLKINEKNRKGMTPIMTASAYNTNPEIVKTLIQNGAKIEDKNDNEETPLMLAVLNNANIKVVRELIEAGADVNAVNRRGETILTLAKRMNKVEFANAIFSAGGTLTATKAKLLSDLDKKLFDALSKSETTLEEIKNIVKSGANVNAQMLYSVTPLMVASANTKDEAVIKFLLDNKANPVSKSDDEEDALMYAAKKSNNPLVIKTLIEYGANIATYDKGGNSALMLASINNKNPKIIDALVKGGSDVNRKNKAGFPSLSLATLNNNIDAINALVSNEATIDIKINDGSTPLINAVKSDNIKSDVAEVLLHLGANPHLKDKTGKSALDYAKSNPNFKDTNAYKTMIAMPSGATLEALNKTLLLLVRNDKTNRGQIEAIVKAGANINATNSDEFLTYVSALNDIDGEVVKNILKVGGLNDADKSVIYNSAKPDSDNAFLKDLTKGKLNVSETLSTPLMLASMYVKDLDAIDFLIKNGADMERKDIYNNTALIYAAAYGSPETVKALLRAGANKSIKNIYDMSALDYARKRNEMTSVLDLL